MKIKLEYLPIVRLENNEPFYVPEKLEIEFESVYVLDKLVVVVKQNELKRKYVITDKKLDLSEFTKQAGVIEINVSLVALGQVAKTWEIEPLLVVDVGGELVIKSYIDSLITPLSREIEDLKESNKKLTGLFNDLGKKHNELALIVKAIKENY